MLILALGLMPSLSTAQIFTTLHNFTEGVDGVSPQAGLCLSGNTLYGATEYGGPYDTSTLFALNTSGTGFTNIYNFTALDINGDNSDGNGPDGTLIISGTTLYGASYYGGTNGNGNVFAFNTNGTFTPLFNFSAGNANSIGNYTNSSGANPRDRPDHFR